MATVSKWTPFGVALDITATGGTVTRKSATQFTVAINVSWETYYDGAQTNYGMTATSGGVTKTISAFDGTKRSKGSASFTGTYSISGNGSATKTITVTFKNFNTDNGDSASKNVTFNVTVPAWTSYTIKYNANNGSGAPGNQTKWKDQTLTLSSTKPTRTGYSFLGWSTSSTATTATYSAGGSYTANAAATLYAVWKANTYTVKYNANGGTGAPGNQTKTYGVTLKLSSTIPTKTNYNFLGWGTSASATTVAYKAGANYTANAAITLYAIWELAYVKPRITNVSIGRCKEIESGYEPSDDGTIAHVTFDWACDREVSDIEISLEGSDGSIISSNPAASGTSGNVDVYLDNLSAELTYTVKITVTDAIDYSSVVATLSGSRFVIDILAEGKGIAFNKPAELENVADIGFQTRFFAGILHPVLEPETDLNEIRTPNTYVGANISHYSYVNCPLTSGTFTLEVTGAGEEGQIKQRIQACSKTESKTYERYYYTGSWGEWVCVSDYDGALLWEGGFFMHDTQEINLSEPISKQRTGIVLVFCRYSSGTIQNYHFSYHFVPKMIVAMHGGCGSTFQMGAVEGDYFASKYLYISDQTIKGNSYNDDVITDAKNGITYTNNATVLRYVIGV